MEFLHSAFKVLLDIIYWTWLLGISGFGAMVVLNGLIWLYSEGRYIYRRYQVHKGAIFVKEKNLDNPFKDTTRVFAEVLDRQDGYVIFKVEGEEISITMREFIRLFRVWHGEYADEEDK